MGVVASPAAKAPQGVQPPIDFVSTHFKVELHNFVKNNLGRQPSARRISGQYSPLKDALLVLAIYYSMWVRRFLMRGVQFVCLENTYMYVFCFSPL